MPRVGGHSVVLKGKVQQPLSQWAASESGFRRLPEVRGVPLMARNRSVR
jgi:hypothetical protein